MQLRARDEDGQPGVRRQELGLGDQAADRRLRVVDHGPGEKVVHDLDCHEVEHDGAQDLVDVVLGLEHARDGAPGRAADGTGKQHERDQDGGRQTWQGDRGRRASQSAHRDLSLAADVEDVGPERDADPHSDQEEGNRLDSCAAESVAPAERSGEQCGVTGERVRAEREHHGGAQQ